MHCVRIEVCTVPLRVHRSHFFNSTRLGRSQLRLTSLLFTKPRSRATPGVGVSAPFTNATPSRPARQAARSAALREMAC
jgi:hypothetical protein